MAGLACMDLIKWKGRILVSEKPPDRAAELNDSIVPINNQTCSPCRPHHNGKGVELHALECLSNVPQNSKRRVPDWILPELAYSLHLEKRVDFLSAKPVPSSRAGSTMLQYQLLLLGLNRRLNSMHLSTGSWWRVHPSHEQASGNLQVKKT
jgi:hypothetical protein